VLWDELLAEGRASSREGGESFALLRPDGYAPYRVGGTDPKVTRVGELRAATTDAQIALWRVLLGLDLMEKVVITTHADDPLPDLPTDARVARTTGRQDGLWLRIMNVPGALEARTYHAELSTVPDVSDGGRYALEIRDGRAGCTPTDAKAEIEMGIDALGSLYLGVRRASTLAAANRLRTKDARLVVRLDAAFVSDVPAPAGFEF
jgi:predicted acetyltransferase